MSKIHDDHQIEPVAQKVLHNTQAGEHHLQRPCDVTFDSRLHDATNSVQFVFLMSYILYIAPLSNDTAIRNFGAHHRSR